MYIKVLSLLYSDQAHKTALLLQTLWSNIYSLCMLSRQITYLNFVNKSYTTLSRNSHTCTSQIYFILFQCALEFKN